MATEDMHKRVDDLKTKISELKDITVRAQALKNTAIHMRDENQAQTIMNELRAE